MTTTSDRYLNACLDAATAQGLDPPMAVLRAAGYPVDLWQSGGFTMVLVVGPYPDGREVWVTSYDANHDYIVGLYNRESLDEGTEAIEYVDTNIGELPSVVRYLTTKEIV